MSTTKQASRKDIEARLTARLQELMFAPGEIGKKADIGGDPEREFEDTFAGLALVYIRDKAPRLMDYLVGFQLIERDDDNNRACGAFVFRPGKLWLLVYVFFLGGKMRGHEMIHVHNQDQFVPLKERWVNTLISARTPVIGKGENRTDAQKGLQNPRLTDLILPPNMSKVGADARGIKNFFHPFVDSFQNLVSSNPHAEPPKLSLRDLVVKSAACRETLKTWTDWYPTMAKYAEERLGAGWYERLGAEGREKAARAKQLLERDSLVGPLWGAEKIAENEKREKVRIITQLEATAEELSAGDREQYLRDGFLVRDYRRDSDTSKAWRDEVPGSADNPVDTGVYDVMVSDKGFEKMVVLLQAIQAHGRTNQAIVLDPEKKNRWEIVPPNKVWTRLSPLATDEWREWFDKLPNKAPTVGKLYYMVTRRGDSLAPFRVISGKDGSWNIEFLGNCPPGKEGDPLHLYNKRMWQQEDFDEKPRTAALIKSEHPGCRLTTLGDAIYYPDEEAKVVEIEWRDCEDTPIQFTSIGGLQKVMGLKTAAYGLERLKLFATASECQINANRPMAKKQALFTLIRDHGFREEDARELLKIADQSSVHRRAVSFWVKKADPRTPNDQFMPVFPGENVPGGSAYTPDVEQIDEEPREIVSPIGKTRQRSPYGPRAAVPDQNLLSGIQEAVESGHHDLADTGSIAGLLQSSSVESNIAEYASDLMNAVDRLCRTLILFYWHNEYFSNQYGKAALPRIEDRVRNAIESVGDTILDLREKLRDIPGQESILS